MTKRQWHTWERRARTHFAKQFESIVLFYDMSFRSIEQGHTLKEEGRRTQWWYENSNGLSIQFDSSILFAGYIVAVAIEDIEDDPCLYDVIRIDESKSFHRENLQVIKFGDISRYTDFAVAHGKREIGWQLDCNIIASLRGRGHSKIDLQKTKV